MAGQPASWWRGANERGPGEPRAAAKWDARLASPAEPAFWKWSGRNQLESGQLALPRAKWAALLHDSRGQQVVSRLEPARVSLLSALGSLLVRAPAQNGRRRRRRPWRRPIVLPARGPPISSGPRARAMKLWKVAALGAARPRWQKWPLCVPATRPAGRPPRAKSPLQSGTVTYLSHCWPLSGERPEWSGAREKRSLRLAKQEESRAQFHRLASQSLVSRAKGFGALARGRRCERDRCAVCASVGGDAVVALGGGSGCDWAAGAQVRSQ